MTPSLIPSPPLLWCQIFLYLYVSCLISQHYFVVWKRSVLLMIINSLCSSLEVSLKWNENGLATESAAYWCRPISHIVNVVCVTPHASTMSRDKLLQTHRDLPRFIVSQAVKVLELKDRGRGRNEINNMINSKKKSMSLVEESEMGTQCETMLLSLRCGAKWSLGVRVTHHYGYTSLQTCRRDQHKKGAANSW